MQIKTLSELASIFIAQLPGGRLETEPLPYLVSRLGSELRHFLHTASITDEVLIEEPAKTGSPVLDTWVAGAAEYLAQQNGLEVPAWCLAPWRFLPEPLFIVQGPRGRDLALVETPSAFRRRNLFCGRSSL